MTIQQINQGIQILTDILMQQRIDSDHEPVVSLLNELHEDKRKMEGEK